jgi:hypothetical protein
MRLPQPLITTVSICGLWSITLLSQSTGVQIPDQAKQLHARAVVIDGHVDTTQRLVFDRTFNIGTRNPNGNLDIPRMKDGDLDALFSRFGYPAMSRDQSPSNGRWSRSMQSVKRFACIRTT